MNDEYNDGRKKQRMKLPKMSIAALIVGFGGSAFIWLMIWVVSATGLYTLISLLVLLLIAAPLVGLILGIVAIPVCKRESSKAGMSMSIAAIVVPIVIFVATVIFVIFSPNILIMMFGM